MVLNGRKGLGIYIFSPDPFLHKFRSYDHGFLFFRQDNRIYRIFIINKILIISKLELNIKYFIFYFEFLCYPVNPVKFFRSFGHMVLSFNHHFLTTLTKYVNPFTIHSGMTFNIILHNYTLRKISGQRTEYV